ncbi:MAG: hypothetical protein Q8N99_07825 [Nanoarchaeota archaeon]|nr:hypothetical protein [Nanoarchaeota archaeon]
MVKKEVVFDNCLKELQRYYDSTLIVTLFSDLFNKNFSLGEIRFIEHDLKKIDDSLKQEIINLSKKDILEKFRDKIKSLGKIEIDLLIKNGKFDILEFKTSISSNPQELDNTIKQILDRDTDLISDLEVLETNNIIFLCHKDDTNNVLNMINERKQKSQFNIKRKLFFLEWIQADNKEHIPCLYIEFKEGDPTMPKIIEQIKKDKVCYPATDLCILRQRKRFMITGKKPPRPYLLNIFKKFLIEYIHPIINQAKVPNEYSLPEDITSLKQQFIEKYTNDYSKPRNEWFDECLQLFSKIKFIRTENNKLIVIINELTKERKEKDDDKFFSRLYSNELFNNFVKKGKKQKKTEEKAKKIREDKQMVSLEKYFPSKEQSTLS